ncbi:MAG: FAD-binding oxidoreductase [Pseudomonadales bacterium]
MIDIVQKLQEILGEKDVLTGDSVSSRSTSYWDAAPMRAKGIARPRTTKEVSAVLKCCHAVGQTLVTHGGLTGTVQGDKSTGQDIVLSLERMTRIEEIDETGRTATLQSGCVLQSLQEAVEAKGLFFPLDLGARGSCTIGGNVATNAGGINVIRYGMARELVLGLEAVLADGTIVSSMNRMLKNNAGYDLKQLFIGSEGTLGVVTRVVVKLNEFPSSANTALVAMDSFQKVADLLKFMDRSMGGHLSSYEVMWGDYFRKVTEPGWHKAPMSQDYDFYVVMEAQGANQERDTEQFQATLEAAFEQELILDAVLPKSDSQRDSVWAIREDFDAVLQIKPQFLYDVSLPIRNMDAYVNEVQQGIRNKWPDSYFYALGHIGDGNLHFFISPQGESFQELHRQVDEVVYRPLQAIGGSVSAEHGIGLEKRAWLDMSRTETEIALMKTLKIALDPKQILNPGKVIDLE